MLVLNLRSPCNEIILFSWILRRLNFCIANHAIIISYLCAYGFTYFTFVNYCFHVLISYPWQLVLKMDLYALYMCQFVSLTSFTSMSSGAEPSPMAIDELLREVKLLSPNIREHVRSLVISSSFRNAKTLYDQIDILHRSPIMSFSMLSALFKMKRSTLYDYYQTFKMDKDARSDKEVHGKSFAAPHCTLTIDEEQTVIDWVMHKQEHFDCPTVREVRAFATQVLQKRVSDALPCSSTWWRSFYRRHSDELNVKVLDSLEDGRTTVSSDDVYSYYGRLSVVTGTVRTLKQIVNMDESGFQQRIDKGRKRKCVTSIKCRVVPKFQEESQGSQVSVIAAINMNGDMLRPALISKERVSNTSKELAVLHRYEEFFTSAKGYQTEATMIDWVRKVFQPYCAQVRREMGDDNLPFYLIMDNCACHSTKNVMQEFENVRSVEIIWLPPHSTHFLQPLDASFFGILKNYYRGEKMKQVRPKIVGKMLKASCIVENLRCFHDSSLLGGSGFTIFQIRRARHVCSN